MSNTRKVLETGSIDGAYGITRNYQIIQKNGKKYFASEFWNDGGLNGETYRYPDFAITLKDDDTLDSLKNKKIEFDWGEESLLDLLMNYDFLVNASKDLFEGREMTYEVRGK